MAECCRGGRQWLSAVEEEGSDCVLWREMKFVSVNL